MLIAVTQRVVENEAYSDRRDALSQDWCSFLARCLPEAVMVPVPNTLPDPTAWAETLGVSGVVLTNGEVWGTNQDRDATEKSLVEWARSRGVPVVGVCRGLQVLNVILGGAPARRLSEGGHVGSRHLVQLDSCFSRLLGRQTMYVNSYHEFGLVQEDLAPGLRPLATAQNVVEAVYHPEEDILAVQWHPERESEPTDQDVSLLVDTMRGRAIWRAER